MNEQFLADITNFVKNPAQFITQKMGIAPNSDPNQIIQQMMNSGKLTQAQYNEAARKAQELQKNPMIKQIMQGLK